MILGFKTKFTDGTPTNFKEQILAGVKIHTLREDVNDRWHTGVSIEMATGVRTKFYNQFNKGIDGLDKCKGTQDVFMTYLFGKLEITIDDKYIYDYNTRLLLIKNDGLTEENFLQWFFSNGKDTWKGKIIHWTDFRY